MTLPNRLILAAIVVFSCALILVGCGGEDALSDGLSLTPEETTSAAEATSTTSAAPATTAPDDLDAYKAAMKEWQELHDPSFQAGAEAMEAIDDPLSASADDVKDMQDFAGAIERAAKDLAAIEPPAQLSSAHEEYRSTLDGMAQGLIQLAQGVKDTSMAAVVAALTVLEEVVEKGVPARDALEEALGFPLSGGDAAEGEGDGAQVPARAGELGTRENPIPLGQEAQVGPWKVKVADVTVQHHDFVLDHNQFNDAPEAGKQYVLITVEATRTGEDAAAFWVDMYYLFVGDGGNTFDSGFAVAPDSISDTGEAYKGASVSGNLVFQVPSDQVAGGALRLEESFSFEDTETFFAID